MTTVDELIEAFDLLGDDWEERFGYIIGLGKQLPPLDESEQIEANRVQGCQSKVWLVANITPDKRIEFRADSDAFIVKGLVAILLMIYSGKTPEEILAFDTEKLFATLGLDRHLSPTRSNGLHAMIQRIRSIAKAVHSSATS